MNKYLRKIGIEKKKDLDMSFDYFYDFYKDRAESNGYLGDLKFIKDRSRILIYVTIDNQVEYENIDII